VTWGDVTREGLERVLKDGGHLPKTLISRVNSEAITGGLGGSTLSRLTIQLTSQNPTKVLVLKKGTKGWRFRAKRLLQRSHREAFIYQCMKEGKLKLSKATGGLRILGTQIRPNLGDFAVIMEDLGGYKLVHDITGKQQGIWTREEVKESKDVETVLEAVIIQAAEFHARYPSEKIPREVLPMLKSAHSQWEWDVSIHAAKSYWARGKKLYKDSVKWSPILIRLMENAFKNSTFQTLRSHYKKQFHMMTLIHGDFHAQNMFWDQENKAVKLVDWSEAAIWYPGAEIAQMFISDIRPALRRELEGKLLDLYWASYVRESKALGNRIQFGKDKFLLSYAQAGLEKWLWLLSVLAGAGLPPNGVQYFHDQVLEFYTDHKSLIRIDSLAMNITVPIPPPKGFFSRN